MNLPDPLIGQQLGDYTIVSHLGRGGMARVYKGYDARLERYAAVKIIDTNLAHSDEADEYRQRFHREARAIARLRHPNIVNVYQFGEHNHLYYMAMMFIDGHDLGQILREKAQAKQRLSYGQIMRIARDIAAALDYAHHEGVIHRDIKPSNIMVMADGHAILTDFGLALSVPEGSIGNTFGSAHYIAPEQALASNNAVPQSDLYSLCVVLYQMLAGKVPFDDPSAMSVAIKHLNEQPPSPCLYNPELPVDVERVVMQGMAKKPEARFPNGAAMVIALEKALRAGGKNLTYTTMPLAPAGEAEERPWRGDKQDEGSTMMLPPDAAPAASKTGNGSAVSTVLPPQSPLAPPHPTGSRPSAPSAPAAAHVREVAAAMSTGSRAKAEPPKPAPPPARGRSGLLIAVALVVLLAIGGAVLLLSQSGQTAEPPTAEPTLEVALEASSTPTVEETPSPRSTATPRAATATLETPEPTVEAAAVPVNLANAPLELTYDGSSFTLTNVSDAVVDISNLEFSQRLGDGTERMFRANQWANESFSLRQLNAGDCVQVWTDAVSSPDAPEDCERRAWRSVSRPRWFWVGSPAVAEFVVRRSQQVLAVCSIPAGECSVSLAN